MKPATASHLRPEPPCSFLAIPPSPAVHKSSAPARSRQNRPRSRYPVSMPAYPRAVPRSLPGGKGLLWISGKPAVRVQGHTGAEPFAEVINEPGGLLPYAKKHLGPVRYADLE